MNYSLKELIKKYQVKAQKRLGQNWLIDQSVIHKMMQLVDIKNQNVVEIGPGLGALTFFLLKETAKVSAYEIDRISIDILQQEFSREISNHQLELHHQDFLTAQLNWQHPRVLFGNIPYYITSDLLFYILKNHQFFSHVVLMVQNEVADRLVAKVGSPAYGKLTVSVNYFAHVQKHFVVKAHQFYPSPKVDSAVISLTFKQDVNFAQAQPFLVFVKKCFAFRRKTLFNNLKTFIPNQKIIDAFHKIGLKLEMRPQQVSVSTFLDLYNHVQ